MVDLKNGDLVWAKMKGYPNWPARIVDPPCKAPNRKAHHYVQFFGTGDFAWIRDDRIQSHTDQMAKNIPKKKYSGYQEGVTELIKESEKFKLLNKRFKKEKIQDTVGTPPKNAVKTPSKKRPLIQDKNALAPKKTKKRCSTNELDCKMIAQGAPALYSWKTEKTSPVSSEIDSDEEVLMCSNKKIGFIGLGLMGQLMVQELLTAKNNLYIWNRTLSKCDPFVKKGAIRVSSPAEIVQKCDITFCCVSDPDAVRAIIFGDNGILSGFKSCERGSKGYVEMTSIDATTSNEIAKAIEKAGMKYLEAPIIGSSKPESTKTKLQILASGDRQLFLECEVCFVAMCQLVRYRGSHIGSSANMNLIASMFTATVFAALAETLALTKRANLSQQVLLEILELSGINCEIIKSKGKAMLQKNFPPVTYLKHQQKDMKLALSLSDACDQPMPVTSAANQLYLRARQYGCCDNDCASVYRVAARL